MESCNEGERISLFSRSEAEILELVYAIPYRVPDHDTSFDVDSLFSATRKSIAGSVEIIDNIIVEKATGVDHVVLETTKPSFSQFCKILLKSSFGCKMSCKGESSEIAFESRTQDILTKLSNYPCEAQLAFALSAFALELDKYSHKLARPVTMLPEGKLDEFNNLIKATMQVIEYIFELEKLVSSNPDSEPKLVRAIQDTPFNVYWSIITLVACATEINNVTNYVCFELYDLSPFANKMAFILDKLKGQLAICHQEKEEEKAKQTFWELVGNAPPTISRLFESLVLFEHKVYPQPPIISVDPSSKMVFNINELEGKCVLFYISSLDDVSDLDVLSLKEIYEEIGQRHMEKYKIVWIPIVDDWSEDGREEQFMKWRSKMPWYAVQYFSPPAIGYLKKEWDFKGNPMVVMMNEVSVVVNTDLIDLIRSQGVLEATVFLKKYTKEKEEAEAKQTLWELVHTAPHKVTEVFKSLVLFEHVAYREPPVISVDPTNTEVFNISELEGKCVLFYISSLGDVCDLHVTSLKQVYDGIEKNMEKYTIVWIPIVEDWTKDKIEEQFKEWRSKMPWHVVQYFSPAAIEYLMDEWGFKGNPMGVVMNQEGDVVSTELLELTWPQEVDATVFLKRYIQEKEETRAEQTFWKLVGTARYEISKVFESLVLFEHIAYPQPPIISVDPSNEEVFNISMLDWNCVLFYISNLDNVCDQDVSSLKAINERLEENGMMYKFVWIPIVKDWSEDGREERFKEWRSKMPWYAVQYFSPPAIRYLKQEWGFKGEPMAVVMNQAGEVVSTNVINLIRTQRQVEAINGLKSYIKVYIAHDPPMVRAEATEVFKKLIFPEDNVEHVLIDGSTNKKVVIDYVLRWKNLLLLVSGLDIPDDYISVLRRVYEGTRRHDSHRIVWIPAVEEWTKEKEKQFQILRLKMPWYTMQCFSALKGMRYMKKKWNFKGKPVVVVMNKQGDIDNSNALPLIQKHGMDAFPFLEEHEEKTGLFHRVFNW